jgi:hypothetical protein
MWIDEQKIRFEDFDTDGQSETNAEDEAGFEAELRREAKEDAARRVASYESLN